MKCRSCNWFGHVKRVCKNKSTHVDENVTVTKEVKASNEMLFMVKESTKSFKKKVWLIDNGISNHMIGDEENFTTLDRSYKGRVEIGN